MPDSLFTAKEVDVAGEKRRRRTRMWVIIAVVVVLGFGFIYPSIAGMGPFFSYWPYERRTNRLFQEVESGDFKRAYSIWQNDPEWENHPERYKLYPYSVFQARDFGPGSEWGTITSHHIDGAISSGGGGIVVAVTVNGILDKKACFYVNRTDKTFSWAPAMMWRVGLKTIECPD